MADGATYCFMISTIFRLMKLLLTLFFLCLKNMFLKTLSLVLREKITTRAASRLPPMGFQNQTFFFCIWVRVTLLSLSLQTYVSVQNASGAVEIEPLPRRFQYHPVIVVVQQCQRNGSTGILGTAVYLHVFHQNCACVDRKKICILFKSQPAEEGIVWQ